MSRNQKEDFRIASPPLSEDIAPSHNTVVSSLAWVVQRMCCGCFWLLAAVKMMNLLTAGKWHC